MSSMKSVENALRVFELLAESERGIGVSELSRRSGVAKSTVQRCLITLRDAGWIEQPTNGPDGRWMTANRLTRLLLKVSDDRLLTAARPIMAELAGVTGDSVHLVRLDDGEVELLDRAAGTHPIQVLFPLGRRVPAHAGATGKVLLAAGAGVVPKLDRLTESTIINPEAFEAELDRIRQRGWAINWGEWHPEIAAVASAIAFGGRAVGALSVSGPISRLTPSRLEEIGPLVAAAASQIARAIDPEYSADEAAPVH
ncbi:MAG: IclR family transcriptional regulator [Actinomycetota bacterium]